MKSFPRNQPVKFSTLFQWLHLSPSHYPYRPDVFIIVMTVTMCRLWLSVKGSADWSYRGYGVSQNLKIILCQTKQATRPKQQYQLQSNIIFQYFLDTIHVSFKCIHVCHGHGTALWVGGRRENSIPNAHVTSRYIVDYLHCICWSCAWLLSWIMDYQNPLN